MPMIGRQELHHVYAPENAPANRSGFLPRPANIKAVVPYVLDVATNPFLFTQCAKAKTHARFGKKQYHPPRAEFAVGAAKMVRAWRDSPAIEVLKGSAGLGTQMAAKSRCSNSRTTGQTAQKARTGLPRRAARFVRAIIPFNAWHYRIA